MTGSRDARVLRLSPTTRVEVLDAVAVEEPLELRVHGKPVTVTMRTPGHDEELARGFLYGEGLLGRPGEPGTRQLVSARAPEALRPDEAGNVLDLELSSALAQLRVNRNFYTTSSCGVCGKSSLAALAVHAPVIPAGLEVPLDVVAGLPARLRAGQPLFEETGGLHAAGLFDAAGTALCVREDVGRHNAVDKVVGWAHGSGRLPAAEHLLAVSGRASFEIVQKAVMAGVPVVVAVSAPSSLAVALADRFGVTLCGFVRQGAVNVYSHPARVI